MRRRLATASVLALALTGVAACGSDSSESATEESTDSISGLTVTGDFGEEPKIEVDGAFHMEVEHWTADVRRQRKVAAPGRTVVRATAFELRLEPEDVVGDLRALGVPTANAVPRSSGRSAEERSGG